MVEITCFNIKRGYYLIDDWGNIYSKISNKYLSYKIDKNGYKDVLLVCEDGIRRHFRVHRLVAATFLDNENDYPIVMHLDNDVQNNHYSNLKWGTISENTQQAYDDGCCSCNKPVYVYDKESLELVGEYISVSAMARDFGFATGYVGALSKIAEGKSKRPKEGKLKNYLLTNEKKLCIKINI